MRAVEGFELEVLYSDEELVAVSKPAGMLCVPGVFMKDCLAARVARQFRHKDVARMVVHRLDQATSGVVVFARTEGALRHLHAQFREKDAVSKRYVALVDGGVEGEEGSVDLPIRKDMEHPPLQMVDMKQGKPSLTRFSVRARGGGWTLLDLFPVTGVVQQGRMVWGMPRMATPLTSPCMAMSHLQRACAC
jgi:tRNA pseudouridine32 synthase/23S rRNA pseudouridine746 synthase